MHVEIYTQTKVIYNMFTHVNLSVVYSTQILNWSYWFFYTLATSLWRQINYVHNSCFIWHSVRVYRNAVNLPATEFDDRVYDLQPMINIEITSRQFIGANSFDISAWTSLGLIISLPNGDKMCSVIFLMPIFRHFTSASCDISKNEKLFILVENSNNCQILF